MKIPKLIVFASGSKDGGGSGFKKLVEATRSDTPTLDAEIAAVVSNHEHGGVREKADSLGIRFIHFPKPWSAENYQKIVEETGAEFVALSGWLKLVVGLDPRTTFNIHPGPLPQFGGPGFYGHHVHEAVLAAFKRGEITHSEVSMHFVSKEYDRGPLFFRHRVPLEAGDTAESIAARVNEEEHTYQAIVTNMVVHREITWNGKDPSSLRVPDWYRDLGRI